MGRLFVSSLHMTVDGPRQSAPAITREWAEPETLVMPMRATANFSTR